MKFANVGVRCILLIIAIVPLVEGHYHRCGPHYTTKKIVA